MYRSDRCYTACAAVRSGQVDNCFEGHAHDETSTFHCQPSTIQNCFKKAGFVIKSLAEVEEILDENDQVSPPSGMEQTDFDEFISFDDRTQCYGELTDTDVTRDYKIG